MNQNVKDFVTLGAIVAISVVVTFAMSPLVEGLFKPQEPAVAEAEPEADAGDTAEEPAAQTVWPGTEGADDAAVAALVPEAVDGAVLEEAGLSGATASVQTKVGAGLNAGSDWWVVLADVPAEDGTVVRNGFIYNRATGTRLTLALDDPWSGIDWSGDTLARGQAALKAAYQSLESA